MIVDPARGPWETWQYAERYLGHRTRSYSPFSADMDVDDAYHPQRGPAGFDLPTFRIPHAEGSYLSNGIGSDLHALYRDESSFLLPVHPQTLATLEASTRIRLERCPTGPTIGVVPSANVRTVFVVRVDGRPVEPHFLKLHYPRRLSRFTRRLRRPIIGLQLWVADELARIGAPCLPEVGGAVFGHDPRQAWGYLIREHLDPSPSYTVPFFALHGTDVRAPDDPTLLEQLIVRSGQPPAVFLTERIVRPMVRLWVEAAVEVGCALEMHGQNTLFQFSADLDATRVVYRDCGIYVDPALRKSRGLPDDLPPTNVIGRDVDWPSEQVFSLAYDSFTGHHALSFLAGLAEQRLGVPEEVLRRAAREEFAERAAGARLLPESVYYYDDRLHADGAFVLVDTHVTPTWR
jgi:hypothetical protein